MGVELSLCPATLPLLRRLPSVGIQGWQDVDAGILEELETGNQRNQQVISSVDNSYLLVIIVHCCWTLNSSRPQCFLPVFAFWIRVGFFLMQRPPDSVFIIDYSSGSAKGPHLFPYLL